MTVTAGALRELHRIHRQLSDLRDQLARGPRQVKAAETFVGTSTSELEQAKDKFNRLRMACDQKELQLKEREGHIEDIRAKLNACSTNREYQAFIEQIAADEQANSVLSDEIIELYDKVAEQEKAVAEAKQKLAKSKEDFEAARKRVDESKDGLENEIARCSIELSETEATLPGEFKSDYKRIVKARGYDALAAVDDQCCGGCYQTISPQMINALSLARPVFCGGCGRLLYLPENTSVGGDR